MILQPIVDIAEICAKKKVTNVILSPGSRCAPLTLAFTRHPNINTLTISDERSAAFIALGMAQKLNNPVALVCTSGSAAYNYAPAVAEAYFQHRPLLILTADRPAEWVDQLDGQTIRQNNIFGKHVKESYQTPVDYDHPDTQWYINRIVNEAINKCSAFPAGPVHINLPFREPFYPKKDQKLIYSKNVRIIEEQDFSPDVNLLFQEDIVKNFAKYKRVLIVAGQQDPDQDLVKLVDRFSQMNNVPVIADIISNFQSLKNAIVHQDAFLLEENNHFDSNLKPDLVISFGCSVISKQLKIFLRKNNITNHWHIQPGGDVADIFQYLTKIYRTDPVTFFSVDGLLTDKKDQKQFLIDWQEADKKFDKVAEKLFTNEDFSEFEAVKDIFDHLPDLFDLHLANSMSVRYGNYLGLKKKAANVFCNRGTSGIDGSTSTALGFGLQSHNSTVLITGDMAFFYDRNALWNNYVPSNLRIIILNNHSGGIFGLIDGPRDQPELEEYFETNQPLTAQNLAKDHGLDYLHCDNKKSLLELLPVFFRKDKKAKILEIETDKEINKRIFTKFKTIIKEIYGT